MGRSPAEVALRRRMIPIRYERDRRTLAEVAQEFGITMTGVVYHLRKAGVERRRAVRPAYSIRPIVEAIVAGQNFTQCAMAMGVARYVLGFRLRALKVTPSAMKDDILLLSPEAVEAYIEAIDQDRVTHADALEIAEDYQLQRRAA